MPRIWTYILDGQDADLAERLDDGRVVFKGGPGGFCAQVDALCPGARPNPCQVFLGE